MSVFKLTDKDREEIIDAAKSIAMRKQLFEISRCPITVSDLEKVLNTPEGLEAANKARAAGYDIATATDIRMRINADSLGLDHEMCPRFIGVSFRVQTGILCQLMLNYRAANWSRYTECSQPYDLTPLDEHKRLEIASWVNKVHRAVRERFLCENVVKKYVALMPTTASVLATWPTLATIVRKETKEGERLRDRFAGGPPARTLHRYRVTWPSMSEFEDPNTMMAGAEEVLVKNLMLEEKYSPLPETGLTRIDVMKFESKPDAPWYLKN